MDLAKHTEKTEESTSDVVDPSQLNVGIQHKEEKDEVGFITLQVEMEMSLSCLIYTLKCVENKVKEAIKMATMAADSPTEDEKVKVDLMNASELLNWSRSFSEKYARVFGIPEYWARSKKKFSFFFYIKIFLLFSYSLTKFFF